MTSFFGSNPFLGSRVEHTVQYIQYYSMRSIVRYVAIVLVTEIFRMKARSYLPLSMILARLGCSNNTVTPKSICTRARPAYQMSRSGL